MYRYFLSVEEHLVLKSLVLRNNIKYHVAFLSFRSLSEYRIQNTEYRILMKEDNSNYVLVAYYTYNVAASRKIL